MCLCIVHVRGIRMHDTCGSLISRKMACHGVVRRSSEGVGRKGFLIHSEKSKSGQTGTIGTNRKKTGKSEQIRGGGGGSNLLLPTPIRGLRDIKTVSRSMISCSAARCHVQVSLWRRSQNSMDVAPILCSSDEGTLG